MTSKTKEAGRRNQRMRPELTDKAHQERVAARVREQILRLAPAEIAVPRRYSIYTLPDRQFPTKCFPEAAYYVQTHRIRGIEYVFGTSVGGGFGNHGWVELPGNILFDGVLQRFYDKTEYYRIEFAMPWYRFTRSAVIWLLEQRMPDWRWHATLLLPWAHSAHDRNVPALLVDKKAAQRFERKSVLTLLRR